VSEDPARNKAINYEQPLKAVSNHPSKVDLTANEHDLPKEEDTKPVLLTEGNRTPGNLTLRIATAIVGVALVLGLLMVSVWGYALCLGAICLACTWEFYTVLLKAGHTPLHVEGMLMTSTLFITTLVVCMGLLPTAVLMLIPILFACLLFAHLFYKPVAPFESLAFTLLGVAYCGFPFAFLHVLALGMQAESSIGAGYSANRFLGVLVMLWCADSGAYFAGKAFGRTKLFERISPKKTWEGLAGGLALALLTAVLLGTLSFGGQNLLFWLGAALIMTICGTGGDLVESMLKRGLALKDSGTLLPGHGGFLDRFDGLLLAAYVIVPWYYFSSLL
jgi:phosphatidate cytidylyltransferase